MGVKLARMIGRCGGGPVPTLAWPLLTIVILVLTMAYIHYGHISTRYGPYSLRPAAGWAGRRLLWPILAMAYTRCGLRQGGRVEEADRTAEAVGVVDEEPHAAHLRARARAVGATTPHERSRSRSEHALIIWQ